MSNVLLQSFTELEAVQLEIVNAIHEYDADNYKAMRDCLDLEMTLLRRYRLMQVFALLPDQENELSEKTKKEVQESGKEGDVLDKKSKTWKSFLEKQQKKIEELMAKRNKLLDEGIATAINEALRND